MQHFMENVAIAMQNMQHFVEDNGWLFFLEDVDIAK